MQCRRPGFCPWGGKIRWRRERPPTPVLWSGEVCGLYSPRGGTESDRTERLSLSASRVFRKNAIEAKCPSHRVLSGALAAHLTSLVMAGKAFPKALERISLHAFFLRKMFIYWAALGLSCSIWDLHCGLWDLVP